MRKARLIRGLQLVETLIAVTLMAMVLVIVAQVAITVSRLTNVVTTASTMEDQGRHQLDQMMQDIKSSSAVLTSYAVGGTTYRTDGTTTLVLQTPSYDSSGNILATNDTIIYHRSGTAAPYSLHRIVCASAGSARSSEADKVVVSNVKSITFSYFVSENFTGDGSTATFSLTAFPSGSGATEFVTESGSSVSLGAGVNQVQFVAPKSLTFGTAPASTAPIYVLYSTSPSTYASQIQGVSVDLKLGVNNTSLGHSSTEAQNEELSSQANLKNHQ